MTENSRDNLVLRGILHGSRAFVGPEIVQFDITNRCNNNCVCCWNNSPFLGELTPEQIRIREFELPFDLVKRTLDKLKSMGTKTIFLAGGGEPFMHPQAMEIIECIKRHGMRLCMNTNFTLVDEEKVRKIVELKVDHIHVSVLAGAGPVYCKMHPNKKIEDFTRIVKLLKYLRTLKEEKQQLIQPHINMYYVVCNMNYLDIADMMNLALEVRANSLEFTPMDAIPGKTDILLLNEKQRSYVLEQVKKQQKRLEEIKRQTGSEPTFIEQCDAFIKRLSHTDASRGLYEEKTVSAQPCYVGWAFLRILANGNVNPCLKAHRITAGNLYENSIEDIWNSRQQRMFRRMTFKLDGRNPYFKLIGNNPDCKFGCLVACDNIQINVEMHEKFKEEMIRNGRIRKTDKRQE